jgi:ATP-dependent Lhr-like helicase
VRWEGRQAWCDRRLLARIQRATLDRLRREIEPVSAADFVRFLAAWQHADERRRLEGPRGVLEAVRQLAGFEAPAALWEGRLLPLRVRGYRREWLDSLTLGGEVAWGRLWGAGASAVRATPISLFPREDLDLWLGLAPAPADPGVDGNAAAALDALRTRGALFPQEIARHAGLLPSYVERALGDLIARGLVTCDAWSGLRQLLVPPSKRRRPVGAMGRWSILRREGEPVADVEAVARRLLARTGVVFRRTLLRERIPVPWRDLVRVLHLLEMRGDVRGGRFVAGFDGEQYALPDAVTLLRAVRREEPSTPPTVAAADPLDARGVYTPDPRVPTREAAAVPG